jgi:hypothetical protein
MKTKMLALLCFGSFMLLGAGGVPAAAMPMTALSAAASGDVVQVYHHGRPHRVYRRYPERIVVYPQRYGYPDYYATSRGFMDPGFAVRGNLPGCATDLGYGRWESCDK